MLREKSTTGLAPFASYYPESRNPPQIPEGKTVETCTQAQARVVHKLYFEMSPGATFDDLVRALNANPEFSKGRNKPITETNLVEMFRAMRESFPWSWRHRSGTAASHALVDALLTTPKGTTYGQVMESLQERHGPSFMNGQALRALARGPWSDEPDRFPFVNKLPKRGKDNFELEAQAEPKSIQYDTRGRLLINRALADKVVELIGDPKFTYDMTLPDFVEMVSAVVPGFNVAAMQRLHVVFPEVVPTFEDARKVAMERLARLIGQIHASGQEKLGLILDELHEKHGYPRYPPETASFIRRHFPEHVPNFRESKINNRLSDAEDLLAAIKKSPDRPYAELARELGLTGVQFRRAIWAIRQYRPEDLPAKVSHPWTDAEMKAVRGVADSLPLGASLTDLRAALEEQAPKLMERHQMNALISVSFAARKCLGQDWAEYQRKKFTTAFVEVVRNSPPGASITQLARYMAEEHPSSYCPGYVIQLVQEWKADPKANKPIDSLLDKSGKFPWEHARIEHSEELAKRVGSLIRKHPGQTLNEYAKMLHEDPEFTKKFPRFSGDSIAEVRVRFPNHVPYVDELKSKGHVAWLENAQREMLALAKKAAKLADKMDSPNMLALATKLGVSEGKVYRAIQKHSDLFPWYEFKEKGTIDLYLATRVAHEMELVPPNATREDIVKRLRADKDFRNAYPEFGVNHFSGLRNHYPDIMPDWQYRAQILSMKVLVDELLAAPKGTPFSKVVAKARKKYPDVLPAAYDRPEYVLKKLKENGGRLPFADALKHSKGQYKLEGQGRPGAISKTESSSALATRLAGLQTIPDSLPLIDKIVESAPKNAFDKFEVIAIQHLLDSQVPTFDAYRKLGMAPGRTSVVGVPYSASESVVEALEDKGWDVRVPPLDLDRWSQTIREVMIERIEAAQESGRKILVLDDGGLVAQRLHEDPDLGKHAHLFRIVEQTRRGITVADGVELKTPVINVAQSWAKFVEGPMIGDSVTDKLIGRLERIGVKSLKGKKVGLLGYGTIGAPIAKELAALGAKVTVFDLSPASLEKAKADGFAVAKDRTSFFSGADILIGSTGVQSISKEDLGLLKDGVILGSASSKLVEIDVEALAEQSRGKKGPRVETIDAESHPPTVEYTLKDRKVKLLASGFPVNFDGGSENIAPEQIQLTRALMLIGGLQAAGAKVAGVNRLDPKKELGMLEVLEGLGVADEVPEVAAALEEAKLNLEVALKRPGANYRRHG